MEGTRREYVTYLQYVNSCGPDSFMLVVFRTNVGKHDFLLNSLFILYRFGKYLTLKKLDLVGDLSFGF